MYNIIVYSKLFIFYRTMIILCSDGSLRLMCSETLLEMTRWEGPVEDFIIVQDQENNDLQIAVLTKPHDDSNSRTLQYLSYPGK